MRTHHGVFTKLHSELVWRCAEMFAPALGAPNSVPYKATTWARRAAGCSVGFRHSCKLVAQTIALCCAAATIVPAASAAQVAHEHGHGQLHIAADATQLFLELEVPAINVVGFEHLPNTPAQHTVIREKLDMLVQHQRWFEPSAAARCLVETYSIALGGEQRVYPMAQTSAAQAVKDAEATDAAHSELHAQFTYRCAEPARLTQVAVRILEALDALEELEASVVSDTVQRQVEITSSDVVIELR
jgi:hypothetical protein